MKNLRRTMLFIPGNNPGMLQNAGILGADSIILDLEDAVSLDEKDSARILVRNAIKTVDYSNCELVVRINPLDTPFGYDDVDTIARVKPDALLLAKATEKGMKSVDELLTKIEKEEGFEEGSIKLIPLIETAYGLENIYSIISSSSRSIAVLLGAEDLTADLGIKRTKEGEEIAYARSKTAAACKALRVDAIDTPFTDTNDPEGLARDTQKAKSIGMSGKAAINPRQVDVIHGVFAPTEAEITYALRVLEAKEKAFKEGKGVFSLDGKMVDAPIIARANATLEKARLSGLLHEREA